MISDHRRDVDEAERIIVRLIAERNTWRGIAKQASARLSESLAENDRQLVSIGMLRAELRKERGYREDGWELP